MARTRRDGLGLMDSRRRLKCKFAMFKIMDRRKFWLGGTAPQTPQFLAGGGQSPPSTPPLKRSFVTFDRGGQTGPPRSNDFFFGAADDTRAADDRPPAVRRPSTVPMVLRYLLCLPDAGFPTFVFALFSFLINFELKLQTEKYTELHKILK